mgnify:CR=1 FL=1
MLFRSGDNFFYGQSLTEKLKDCAKLHSGAKVFLHPVNNPSLYGVAKINKKHKILIVFWLDPVSMPIGRTLGP